MKLTLKHLKHIIREATEQHMYPSCEPGCTRHDRPYCHCQSCGETGVELDRDGYCAACTSTTMSYVPVAASSSAPSSRVHCRSPVCPQLRVRGMLVKMSHNDIHAAVLVAGTFVWTIWMMVHGMLDG